MEHQSKLTFMRRMSSMSVPLKARLELTRRCTLSCIHCKVHINRSPGDELTPLEISRLVRELRDAGTVELSLTGGDVFARAGFYEILSDIFTLDFRVHIQTSGVALDGAHIELLERNKHKILKISMSLYSHNPAVHDSITQTPGSHARTLAAISALRAARVPFNCFTLLMRANAQDADALKKFYRENDIPHGFNSVIIPDESGCIGPLEHRLTDETLPQMPIDWNSYIDPDPSSAHGCFTHDAGIHAICQIARFPVITAEGNVIPCAILRQSAGNVRESSFTDIWNNSSILNKYRNIKIGDLECSSCEEFPRCKPCIALAALEHGDPLKPPAEFCRITKHLLKPELD